MKVKLYLIMNPRCVPQKGPHEYGGITLPGVQNAMSVRSDHDHEEPGGLGSFQFCLGIDFI